MGFQQGSRSRLPYEALCSHKTDITSRVYMALGEGPKRAAVNAVEQLVAGEPSSAGLTPFGAALRGYIDGILDARDHHDATDSPVLVTDPAGVIPPRRDSSSRAALHRLMASVD